jgi:hypothetical protein
MTPAKCRAAGHLQLDDDIQALRGLRRWGYIDACVNARGGGLSAIGHWITSVRGPGDWGATRQDISPEVLAVAMRIGVPIVVWPNAVALWSHNLPLCDVAMGAVPEHRLWADTCDIATFLRLAVKAGAQVINPDAPGAYPGAPYNQS